MKTYGQVVPELASLLDHMERKSPVLVISTADASMGSFLPFQLPSDYGCFVLGFFDVEKVEVGDLRSSCKPVFLKSFLTSVGEKISLLPRAFDPGNFRGECNCVMRPHRIRRNRAGTWFRRGGWLRRPHRRLLMRWLLPLWPPCWNRRRMSLKWEKHRDL